MHKNRRLFVFISCFLLLFTAPNAVVQAQTRVLSAPDISAASVFAKPSLSASKKTLYLGKSFTLKLNNATSKTKWKSGDKTIASVSSSGRVTANKPGSVTITAVCAGNSYSCRITVPVPQLKTTVDEKTGSVRISAERKYSSVSYQSSNPDVVSVDSDGKLTFTGAGKAQIEVRIKNYKKTIPLSVVNGKIAEGSLAAASEVLLQKIDAVIQSVISEDMEDAEIVKQIHDYLVLHAEYNIDGLNGGTLTDDDYSAAGILIKGTGVCQGYTDSFSLFMEALGIECVSIPGTASGSSHIWNAVKLDGSWYHVDVTWDDPIGAPDNTVYYDYFLVPDEIMETEHSWNRKESPVCKSSDYLLYPYRELTADSLSELDLKIGGQIEEGLSPVTVVYADSLTQTDIFNLLSRYYPSGFRYSQPEERGGYTIFQVFK